MTFLHKLVHRSRSRESFSKHRRSASAASAVDKDLPAPPSSPAASGGNRRSSRGPSSSDDVPPVPAVPKDVVDRANVDGKSSQPAAAAAASSAQVEGRRQTSSVVDPAPATAAPNLASLHGPQTSTHAPTTFSSTAIPAASSSVHYSGDLYSNIVIPDPEEVHAFHPPDHQPPTPPRDPGVAPTIALPKFDDFSVPLATGTPGADGAAPPTAAAAGGINVGARPSGDAHIQALSSQLESSTLSDGPAGGSTTAAELQHLVRPQAGLTAHALASPLAIPDLHPTHFADAVASSTRADQPNAAIASHAEQNARTLAAIRAAHHPAKQALPAGAQALFDRAGLEVRDAEGRGRVDWIEVVEKPVVREVVKHRLDQVYEPVVVGRTIHATHIIPKIQPIVREPSTDPEDELHYFKDAAGHWREVKGRSAARELLRLSGAEATDEVVADFWDGRAVERERAELEAVVRGDLSAVDGRRVLSVRRFKEEPLILPAGVEYEKLGGGSSGSSSGAQFEDAPVEKHAARAIGQAI